MMAGYNPNFLPEYVPLPEFAPSLEGEVLTRPELRDGRFADYANYTIAMHRPFRTLLFAALNVDQTQYRRTGRSDRWRIDTRIGSAFQLNNDYYHSNPWDRGHLARRATAAWGATEQAAQFAADETFYFSNASLQHRNFNQDEWLALEEWVFNLDIDKGDRFSELSGPIFGDFMRTIRPEGREAAFIPSAYFKVILFMDKQDRLQVRAFMMPQDAEALADRRGRRVFNDQTYQVSVAEIEMLTGLTFPEVIPRRNPIYFNESDKAKDAQNVHEFPERREVGGPEDIIRDSDTRRPISFADDRIDVFLAAAMVNPADNERDGEWVSIINLTAGPVSIDGWKLSDDKRRIRELKGTIGPGEARRIQPLSPVQLANSRNAFIQLINDRDEQIDRVTYTKEQAALQGKPIVFAYREIDYDKP